jgi:hypothetical protein
VAENASPNAEKLLDALLTVCRSLAGTKAPQARLATADAKQQNVIRGTTALLAEVGERCAAQRPLVQKVVHGIVDVLATPDPTLQAAAADALCTLAKGSALGDALVQEMVAQFLSSLNRTGKFGQSVLEEEPRGAAYGLVAIIEAKGTGILKPLGVIEGLKAAVVQKAHPHAREGALFTWQLLSERLGHQLAPYTMASRLLSLLLVCCDDKNNEVRIAAEKTLSVVVQVCFPPAKSGSGTGREEEGGGMCGCLRGRWRRRYVRKH